MILGVYPLHQEFMDDPGYLGKFWVGGHDHCRSIFFILPISRPIIEILTLYFQHMILGVYPLHGNLMDDPGYLGNFSVHEHDHYRSIFFV